MKKLYLLLAILVTFVAAVSASFACQTWGYQPKMRE
jgi:cyclic lactone autoinducer peptide